MLWASMSRKVVERHVWQEALDRVNAFTKTYRGQEDIQLAERNN